MKALLIAEKPSLMRTIEAVYKKHRSEFTDDIDFESQRGHLVTLKLPSEMSDGMRARGWESLPFHPEDHGGWEYKAIEEKRTGNFPTAAERLANIKKLLESGEYDYVIHAGDPDQEGELLVNLVLTYIGNTLPVKRFWTNATTEAAVLDALKNLRDDQNDTMLTNLLAAAYGRQHSDYRVGMNLSTAATLQMGGRAAVGRVKTPILAMVCRREKEIEGFTPKTVYGIRADYANGADGTYFIPQQQEGSGGKDGEEDPGTVWFDGKSEAEGLIKTLGKNAVVESFEEKETKKKPPKLFKLSTAQVAAGKYGLSADITMDTIQALYDKQWLSYPRTSCEYLSSTEDFGAFIRSASFIPEIAPFAAKITGADIERVKKDTRWVNDKAIQEEGHTALRPTEEHPDFAKLSHTEQVVYRMVCMQYIAIFLPPLIQKKIRMETDIGGHAFVTNGRRLVSPGYTELFGASFTDKDIPPAAVGDVIPVSGYAVTEKTSACPQRFTSTTLVAACENPAKYLEDQSLKSLGRRLHIGTEATRTGIIKGLVERDRYLEEEKSKKTVYLKPTTAGRQLIENLDGMDICRVDMTGQWEERLEMVRKGTLTLDGFEQEMRRNVEKMIDGIKAKPMGQISSRPSPGTCPACGGNIISGKKSYFCSNYKSTGCGFGFAKEILGAEITENDAKGLLSGKNLTKKFKKDGKEWRQEVGVTKNGLEFIKAKKEATPYKCPVCGGMLYSRERSFLCENYKGNGSGCSFAIPKVYCGHTLTEDDVTSLLGKGRTEVFHGLISKSKKKFDAALVIKDGKFSPEFAGGGATVSGLDNYMCPVCGQKALSDGGRVIKCTCGFTFWKKIAGKELSEEDIREVLGSGSTSGIIYGFTSKRGKTFNAKLAVNKDEKSVRFDFVD